HDPPERLVGGAPDLTHATATDQAVQPEAAGKQLPRARHPAVSSSPAKAGPAYRRPVSGVPRPPPGRHIRTGSGPSGDLAAAAHVSRVCDHGANGSVA